MITNYSTGHEAEEYAAEHLRFKGYKVHELNWRTRVCEVDIVAEKSGTLHFVEVKFRRNGKQGFGLDYITAKKLQQMKFAAQCWIEEHRSTKPFELSAIEVGANFEVTEFLPTLT